MQADANPGLHELVQELTEAGYRFELLPAGGMVDGTVREVYYAVQVRLDGLTTTQLSQLLEIVDGSLFRAPPQVLQELQAIRPGVYMIHDDAPRPYRAVLELMDALPVDRLRADGIRIVGYGPTQDGHFNVRVMGDVPPAQERLDAMYGEDVAQVEYGEPAIAC